MVVYKTWIIYQGCLVVVDVIVLLNIEQVILLDQSLTIIFILLPDHESHIAETKTKVVFQI